MQKRKKDFMMLRDVQSANETFQDAHPKKSHKKSKARPTSSCERHTIRSCQEAPPCGFSEQEGLRDGPLEKLLGGGEGECSSCTNFF